MNQQPPWFVTAVVGAMIGFLLPYALRTLIWFARRFTKHYLEGDWFEYHMTFRGHQATLGSERWLIRRGFWSDLSVTITSFPMPDVRYKGTVTEERSNIVIRLKASTHTEQVTCRLQSPIPLNADKAAGFWLAVDFDGRITAGSELISRTALKEEEVRRLFSTYIETEPSTGLMRLSA